MNIGITNSAYTDYYGYERGIEKIAEHGYNCIDAQHFCNTEQELFTIKESEFEKRLKAECKFASSFGLYYNQSHGPWRWPPRDFTPEERAERFEKMSRSIRGTAYIGAKHFVIHCIMPFGCECSESREIQVEMNREFFGRLLEVAREYNVIINLENLPFPKLPISRTSEVLDFVKSMNTPYMRICLDTGHCSFYGDSPADAVRMIGKDCLATLHVHDNDGPCDRHWNPGRGIINWSDFSLALYEIGFDGAVSLETAVPRDVTTPAEREACECALAASALRIANGKW